MSDFESITRYLWPVVIAGALAITMIAALRPRLIWPLLIVATLGAGSLNLNGLTFIDEILAGCVLIGIIAASIVSRSSFRRNQERPKWNQIHLLVFILFAMYMMVESFRGMVDLESPRKIRWVIYFGGLLVMLYFLTRRGAPFGTRNQIAVLISTVALLYFAAYFAHGFLTESLRGISRYSTQSVEWGGTTAAMYPMVIAIPAAMLLTNAKARVHRSLGWATLLLMVVVGFYYSSRIAWMVMFAFMAVAPFTLGIRKFALMSGIFASVAIIFVTVFWPEWYNLELFLSSQILNPFNELIGTQSVDDKAYDYFREIHLKIAFPAISSSWHTFLFGYGFHATPEGLLGQYAVDLLPQNLWHLADGLRATDSTEGFTALVTDTGLIGLLLFGANFLVTGREIIFAKAGSIKFLLLVALALTFGYIFVANILNFLLIYLLIMPSGLLVQWAKSEPEQIEAAASSRTGVPRSHADLLPDHASL